MGDSRFTSIAYGKFNNFAANTAGLFAQGDTTPDVTSGVLFYSNNTTATAITDFELSAPGGGGGSNAGLFEGKAIKVIFLDDSTRLISSARMLLAGSNDLQGTNNSVELLYHNSAWVEFSRSYNQSNVITFSSAGWLTATGNPVMNASTGNVNITGRGWHVVIKDFQAASSAIALRRAVGGEEGQLLTVMAIGSAALVIVNSDASDTFICTTSASSTQFRLASSAAIQFVYNNRRWHEIVPIFPNSSTILAT